MEAKIKALDTVSSIFGTAVFAIGILNLILIHAAPGIIYLLLSCVYFPPANGTLTKRFGRSIPLILKIFLGIIIVIFTLGVSDLGDMVD